MGIMWPTSLPQKPNQSSYTHEVPCEVIRTSMETGPDKIRYRGGHMPEIITATYLVTTEQKSYMRDFLHDTLKCGAIYFDWPVPDTNSLNYVLARVKSDGTKLCTFTPVGPTHWNAMIKLEIWPGAPLTSA